MTTQLDIMGGETPLDELAPRTAHGPTRQQLAILARLDRDGSITSTTAGVILHGFRPMPAYLQREANPGECPRHAAKRLRNVVPATAASDRWPGPGAEACCPWAATDGCNALKRLHAAGHVQRHPEIKGRWVRPDTPGTM